MASIRGLNDLARLYGLQTAYEDVTGKRQAASRDALLQVLQIMGASLSKLEEVPDALRQRQAYLREQLIEPVTVAWNGRLPPINVCLRPNEIGQSIEARLMTESGEQLEQSWSGSDLQFSQSALGDTLCSLPFSGSGAPAAAVDVVGNVGVATKSRRMKKLQPGYHRLSVSVGGRTKESLVISAPRKLDTGSLVSDKKQWGVFAPMYALHGQDSWGAGGIAEFDQFASWVRDQGGTLVASLPLLASFFDNGWDVSPYSPASRLFWNEFFVEVRRAPEFEACAEAKQLAESAEFQKEVGELRAGRLAGYLQLMPLKRRMLEKMAECFFNQPSDRRNRFEELRQASPDLDEYAKFRAACERLGRPWMHWPEAAREGNLPEEPADEPRRRYHLYVQWLAFEQLDALSRRAAESGMTWYLDLPLGTHPDGYDVWKYRHAFALGASGGAPPDAFFTKGQSWGFPPLHPHKLREHHYDYFIRVLRHHLQQARLLRIDHVMGLHRLYWVPNGSPASQGVYVRYPAEELYAILLLEAHRHGGAIIGENLGTVPVYVNRAMRQHGFGRLWVLQYEMHLPAGGGKARSPDPDEVASLNTHDMPTFATWWEGKDIDDRFDLGLMDEAQAEVERTAREELRQSLISLLRERGALDTESPDLPAVLRGCLRWLATSDAKVMLINVEDLWLETESQNVPGTVSERVNWQRKTRLTLEQLMQSPEIVEMLREVNRLRKG